MKLLQELNSSTDEEFYKQRIDKGEKLPKCIVDIDDENLSEINYYLEWTDGDIKWVSGDTLRKAGHAEWLL